MPVLTWVLSFAVSVAVAGLARHLRALSGSGLIAATVVGTIITAAGGWQWGAILLAFFVSSSVLSKLADRLRPDHDLNTAGGSERDVLQVLANSAIPVFCACAALIGDQSRWYVVFAASLAVANADTWATEIGSLSRLRPRLITTGRSVEAGTSGAISPLGIAGTALGAVILAILAALLAPESIEPSAMLILAFAIGGLAGSLIDSVLGATIQLQLFCPDCYEVTEAPIHHCGAPTVYLRGEESLTNDAINTISILAGAVIGWLIWAL